MIPKKIVCSCEPYEAEANGAGNGNDAAKGAGNGADKDAGNGAGSGNGADKDAGTDAGRVNVAGTDAAKVNVADNDAARVNVAGNDGAEARVNGEPPVEMAGGGKKRTTHKKRKSKKAKKHRDYKYRKTNKKKTLKRNKTRKYKQKNKKGGVLTSRWQWSKRKGKSPTEKLSNADYELVKEYFPNPNNDGVKYVHRPYTGIEHHASTFERPIVNHGKCDSSELDNNINIDNLVAREIYNRRWSTDHPEAQFGIHNQYPSHFIRYDLTAAARPSTPSDSRRPDPPPKRSLAGYQYSQKQDSNNERMHLVMDINASHVKRVFSSLVNGNRKLEEIDYIADVKKTRHDYSKAMEWYEKKAKEGVASAQLSLGLKYFHGHGAAQQDYFNAWDWIEKAAKQEYAAAQYNLDAMKKTREYELHRCRCMTSPCSILYFVTNEAFTKASAKKKTMTIESDPYDGDASKFAKNSKTIYYDPTYKSEPLREVPIVPKGMPIIFSPSPVASILKAKEWINNYDDMVLLKVTILLGTVKKKEVDIQNNELKMDNFLKGNYDTIYDKDVKRNGVIGDEITVLDSFQILKFENDEDLKKDIDDAVSNRPNFCKLKNTVCRREADVATVEDILKKNYSWNPPRDHQVWKGWKKNS